MLQSIVVMFERAAGVIGRIDEHALDTSSKLLLQRLQGQKIVAENEPVIENVVIGHSMRGVVGLPAILEQNPRLQPRPILLAYPRQLELLLLAHRSATPLARE